MMQSKMRHEVTKIRREHEAKIFFFVSSSSLRAFVAHFVCLSFLIGCQPKQVNTTSAEQSSPPPRAWLLHLPGIGGHMPIDDSLIAGFKQAALDADLQIYDWTG